MNNTKNRKITLFVVFMFVTSQCFGSDDSDVAKTLAKIIPKFEYLNGSDKKLLTLAGADCTLMDAADDKTLLICLQDGAARTLTINDHMRLNHILGQARKQ